MSNTLYEPHVIYEYYCDVYKGTVIPMSELDKALRQVNRHTNPLTYNRIVGRGFSDLTTFQQDVIQEVVCQQTDLECENTDEIDMTLPSCNLNGTSVQFDSSWNIHTDRGVTVKRGVCALLSQTGLCYRLVR